MARSVRLTRHGKVGLSTAIRTIPRLSSSSSDKPNSALYGAGSIPRTTKAMRFAPFRTPCRVPSGNWLPQGCVQTPEVSEGISHECLGMGLMGPLKFVRDQKMVAHLLRAPIAVACVSIFLASSSVSAATLKQPLRFFEGRTE